MPPRARLGQALLAGAALICGLLLFLGGPDLVDTRSFRHTWDLGHIVAFAVWTRLLMHQPRLAALRWRWQFILALGLVLAVGGTVEVLQGTFGRYPSWADMGRNLLGALIVLGFWVPARKALSHARRRAFQLFTLALLLLALVPLGRSLCDEWQAWRSFPVLGDFEAPCELDRWSGSADLSIDGHHSVSGRCALQADLSTARYSGAALHYFPGDWRGWRWLTFSVFNPDPEPIRLVCKINDHLHDISGYRFNDRFNRRVAIDPGWQRVRIDLADVRRAPADREMDLARVTEFNLFAVSLTHQRTIYLDRLVLER